MERLVFVAEKTNKKDELWASILVVNPTTTKKLAVVARYIRYLVGDNNFYNALVGLYPLFLGRDDGLRTEGFLESSGEEPSWLRFIIRFYFEEELASMLYPPSLRKTASALQNLNS